tara:strand:+ start:213 stop:440 length:228 start_codon:yes stop_codon:yes gene_type:complete
MDFDAKNYPKGIQPLTENIVYDSEMEEVVVRIERIHLGFTIEEFALISKEFLDATKAMQNIFLKKIQSKKIEEIN